MIRVVGAFAEVLCAPDAIAMASNLNLKLRV